MANKKAIGADAAGYDILTKAIKDMLNSFPGLMSGENVKFEELKDESGIAFSNNTGALVYTSTKDVIGYTHQTCKYLFVIVYRTSAQSKEQKKLSVQEFLEAFGRWLCMEECNINGKTYILYEYPKLSGGREIKDISRDNCYACEPQTNGVQDWILPITIEYTHDFKKTGI